MNPKRTEFFSRSSRHSSRLGWRGIVLASAVTTVLAGCAAETALDLEETDALLASFARSVQNVYSGKCLHAASLASGAQVQQSTCNGSNNQKFLIEPGAFGGQYKIRNTSANLCVVANGYSGWSDTEVALVLAGCGHTEANFNKENPVAINGGERTGFRWVYDSQFCIHAPSTVNGVQLLGRACSIGGDAQKFEVRVNAAPPPPPPPPLCPRGQICCEPEGSGCALCVPSGAHCP
jgi:hypothetical protein